MRTETRVRKSKQKDEQSLAPSPSGSFLQVLRNTAFLRLWLAQLISQICLNASNYGLIVLVVKESGSLTATAFTVVAFNLPPLLFSTSAGAVVDRFNRHTVLWVSNMLRILGALLYMVSLLTDRTSLIPLYLLSIFMATVASFFTPAEGAAIPALVAPKDLPNALSLFNITLSLAQAIGLVLLGPLVLHFIPAITLGSGKHTLTLLPIDSLFLIIAFFYAVCTAILFSLPQERLRIQQSAEEHRGDVLPTGGWLRHLWKESFASWPFIRRDHMLAAAIWQFSLGGVIAVIFALIAPRFVEVFLRQPPELAGLIFIPAGVGLVGGSALMPHITQRLKYIPTMVMSISILAACPALLTLLYRVAPLLQRENWWNSGPYFGIVLFLTGLMGLAIAGVSLPAQTLMQKRSPDWIKGRVLAFQQVLLNGLTIPGVLLIGQLDDRFGLIPALEILTIVVLTAGLGSVFYSISGQRTPRKRR